MKLERAGINVTMITGEPESYALAVVQNLGLLSKNWVKR